MRIAVILSAYNGEKYIREQIDSILAQEEIDVELYIRDDGSHDATLSIVRKYEDQFSNVHVRKGANLGFRQSFIQELLAHKGYDYYAFSDQDDFWEKEKLSVACSTIQMISSPQIPTVYYSNLNIADENLNIMKRTELERRKHSLTSTIMRRSIAGCTMVFNKAMWDKIAEHQITEQMLRRGHDSFIISLCYSIGGCVLCDDHAYIRYRQHRDNTSGGMNGPIQRIKKEWTALTQKKGQESEIARAILDAWEDEIDTQNKRILKTVASSKNILSRINIVTSSEYSTGNIILTLLGKLRALLGVL